MLLLNSMGFILVVWHFKQQQRAARHCHWFHAIDNYAWYNICKSSSANCFEFMSPPLASKVCKFTIDFQTDCQFDKWLRNQNIEWQRENEWLTRDERKWYVMAGIRNWNSSPHFANPISPFALISNRFLSRNCLILFIKCSKYNENTLVNNSTCVKWEYRKKPSTPPRIDDRCQLTCNKLLTPAQKNTVSSSSDTWQAAVVLLIPCSKHKFLCKFVCSTTR